jgi:hypothetical protein
MRQNAKRATQTWTTFPKDLPRRRQAHSSPCTTHRTLATNKYEGPTRPRRPAASGRLRGAPNSARTQRRGREGKAHGGADRSNGACKHAQVDADNRRTWRKNGTRRASRPSSVRSRASHGGLARHARVRWPLARRKGTHPLPTVFRSAKSSSDAFLMGWDTGLPTSPRPPLRAVALPIRRRKINLRKTRATTCCGSCACWPPPWRTTGRPWIMRSAMR